MLRRYGCLFAIAAPVYFCTLLIVGEHHDPALSPLHILAVAGPYFLAGFVGHLLFGFLAVAFIVTVGSLVWWRHVLAVGGPAAAPATLAAAARRLVTRIERRVDTGLVATLARREHNDLPNPAHDLLHQLRAALLVAPAAPPLRLALNADPLVRTDNQLTLRRSA